LAVNAIAIIVFFTVYLRSQAPAVTWRLRRDNEFNPFMGIVILGFIVVAGYSLLAYRAGVLSPAREKIIEAGRFVGETTGYENTAHMFLFVPIVLLLLTDSRAMRLLGWVLGLAYIWLSLPHAWARFATVAMLLAMSVADTVGRARTRPRVVLIIAAIVLATTLQLRGHQEWTLASTGGEFIDTASQAFDNLGRIASSSDSSMLATWYLESYVKDTLVGYDYGIPLMNYLLTGWIPYRLFPDKYFAIDWLHGLRPAWYSPMIDNMLYGAKSSLIGSFYANGGLAAVVLLMAFVGFLSRRMDGMLHKDSPLLIRAIGISWVGVLWMVWGSHDYWGAKTLGTLLMPGLFLWLVAPKEPSRKRFRYPDGMVRGSKGDAVAS
jgi:hypothetical protein